MKLDMDCVRQTLLAVESAAVDDRITMDFFCKKMPSFEESEIEYACLKLEEGGYLVLETVPMTQQILPGVKLVLFAGHEFLEKTRDDKHWAEIKKVGSAVRVFSLEAIKSIAEGISGAAISKHFS